MIINSNVVQLQDTGKCLFGTTAQNSSIVGFIAQGDIAKYKCV